ncbi:hypothetical protein ACQZV8_12260 [Magnetococcales bacterium HHB-1]
MPDIQEQDKHWLVRQKTIKGLWVGFIVILSGLALADLIIHGHPHFGIDGIFGFYSWYGLITCAAMVAFAKGLGMILKRKDDYYDA